METLRSVKLEIVDTAKGIADVNRLASPLQ
jgi:hypothetical protein